ncbi:ABC transporter permease [Agrococcus baldri]|uniref:Nitrate ABC transporter permease n=1 Tax=Agrococcus baldri TaxID=153730 RepID=A0AA87UTF0_9MICO|nr:ABC transporter permease [Agrococcus baldri]GEK81614.1 nitrate ABC transporter permease [Agrococcus baldri]
MNTATATTVTRRNRLPLETRPQRLRRRRRLEATLGIAVPVVLIGLWEVAARLGWINAQFFPAPSSSVIRGVEMIIEGRLLADIGITAYRVLVGYVLGTIIGFAAGVGMGMSPLLRKALEPMLSALYTVPKIAILPIFLTIFGFSDAPIIAIVTVTVFFYIWIYTMEAVVAIPNGYLDAAKSFGVKGWAMFRHVVFPASLPSVAVGLRVGVGVALLITISSEFIVGGSGVGYLIFNARALFRLEEAYAGIVTAALIGVILQGTITWLGHRVTPWVVSRESRAAGL